MTGAEEWRPVVGYEGFYEVSSFGRIRRIMPGPGSRAGKVLRHTTNRIYKQVGLSKGCVQRTRRVHQLVAEAFLGPCPPELEVNHKDGRKHNNAIDNLEYVTRLENLLHAAEMHRGKGHSFKLSVEAVHDIREFASAMSRVELSKRYGVDASCISRVVRGEAYRHVPPRPSEWSDYSI